MSYRLEFLGRARKEFLALPKAVRDRFALRMGALVGDPRGLGTAELGGDLKGLRRLRVGDYRAAYEVDDAERRLRFWGFGHRQGFYDSIRRRLA